ncbi:MAG: two-component system sensor histidine kinase NtrB [Bacillota bacterium]
MNVKAWCQSLIKGKQKSLDAHVYDYRLSHLPQHVLDQLEGCKCDFYLVTDIEGFIQYHSKSTLHYLPQNFLDRPHLYQWLHPDSHELFSTRVKEASSNLSARFTTIKIYLENDTPFTLGFNALRFQKHMLFIFQHQPSMHIAQMTPDQERLITIGEMAAGLVHEFKNPLTSLKGFIELIKAGVPYEKEYFRVISDELQRMDALTTELLTLSKPAESSMTVLQLNQLCLDVSLLFKHQLNKRRIRLINHFDQTIYCLGNACQLKQVLINLIKNAMEAIEEAGIISIELTKLANTAVIQVIDNGGGIPEEQLTTIMEPFFTTKKTGTGLGLAVTRKIMTNHHGEITAVSTLNKGTTFTLTLPCLLQHPMEQIS